MPTGFFDSEGITISFSFSNHLTEQKVRKSLIESININKIDWLIYEKPYFTFKSKNFKAFFTDNLPDFPWLNGDIMIEPEYEIIKRNGFDRENISTTCRLIITSDLIMEQLPKKIFLSHSGMDKPRVRQYKNALQTIGLSPWLDEDAMIAGTELERGLLQGFKESCAAVFFATPNYQDHGYIATEINYAIKEKREKKDRFSIITLQLTDLDGNTGTVPELLQQYVWKNPSCELDAYCEIVRALPIKIPSAQWK